MKLKTFTAIARGFKARNPRTITMLKEHLVYGLSMRDVAKKYGVTFQLVGQARRHFMAHWQATPLEKTAVKLVEIVEKESELLAQDRDKFINAIDGVVK